MYTKQSRLIEPVFPTLPESVGIRTFNLFHKLIIGDAQKMSEIPDRSIDLMVTSPPYFKMRNHMDYNSYEQYMEVMNNVFKEVYRVMKIGRVIAINISDYMVNGVKYSIPADFVIMLKGIGLRYNEDIIWVKPIGIKGGAGKRAGNVVKNLYPLYFYPNNIYEHILIFSRGEMARPDYKLPHVRASKLKLREIKPFLGDVWEFATEIKNQFTVDESHPAMFPETLPRNIIMFYSHVSDVVLDPFVGSGTTLLAARNLRRSSIGIEINPKWIDTIKEKVGWNTSSIGDNIRYDLIIRDELK